MPQNTEEVNAIVSLVEAFYHDKEFCIITPYDLQRGAIAEALRHAKLPADITEKAESFIYNVDSFQGTSYSSPIHQLPPFTSSHSPTHGATPICLRRTRKAVRDRLRRAHHRA